MLNSINNKEKKSKKIRQRPQAPLLLYYLDDKALATGNSGGITPALLGHFFKKCIPGIQKRTAERKSKENWKK